MLARIAVLAAVLLPQAPLHAQQERLATGIYGEDDRRDIYQVHDPRLLNLAAGTLALIADARVTVKDGVARIRTAPYLAPRTSSDQAGETYDLCTTEPFHDQRKAAHCSGSLVGPDLVMTAGHCVETEHECRTTKFVFGYAVTAPGRNPESVPASEVYGCGELIASVNNEETGSDWALVRLDRTVRGHSPLPINRSGGIEEGAKLVVIGHPAGLPTKVAGGAVVRDASRPTYFKTNLDTYGGNSGSAVFNAATGLIEGILVRGGKDFEKRGSCWVSKVCPDDGCGGESVTRISETAGRIPSLKPAAWDLSAAFSRPTPARSSLQDMASADAVRGLRFDGGR